MFSTTVYTTRIKFGSTLYQSSWEWRGESDCGDSKQSGGIFPWRKEYINWFKKKSISAYIRLSDKIFINNWILKVDLQLIKLFCNLSYKYWNQNKYIRIGYWNIKSYFCLFINFWIWIILGLTYSLNIWILLSFSSH